MWIQGFYAVVNETEIDFIDCLSCRHQQRLEVDPKSTRLVDVGNIISNTRTGDVTAKLLSSQVSWRSTVAERPNSDYFIDCDDVPPLM